MRIADLTHAQIARTAAGGRHPGIAQIAWSPGPFRVRHACDAEGNPIVLCRADGPLARALRPRAHDDTAVVLDIDSPAGRVWISGWAHPIHGDDVRRAALEFWAGNPTTDLLGLGAEFELHHLDVAEVRLEVRGQLIEIDVEDYAAAVPIETRDH